LLEGLGNEKIKDVQSEDALKYFFFNFERHEYVPFYQNCVFPFSAKSIIEKVYLYLYTNTKFYTNPP